MSCPTCDHTVAKLTGQDDMHFFHCERCGTVVVHAYREDGSEVPGFPRVYVPKLVERCRTFEAEVVGTYGAEPVEGEDTVRSEWHRLGITEAINLPGDRP